MSAKAKRILALLRDPRHRERMMQSMNRDNTDSATPVGGQEQGMKVLQEMNGLDQEHDQHIQDIGPKLTVY
jgi:hypothetical protein